MCLCCLQLTGLCKHQSYLHVVHKCFRHAVHMELKHKGFWAEINFAWKLHGFITR
jgi:hypothetical protein